MGEKGIFVGLDMGASRTKVAVLDGRGALLGHSVKKSGTDFTATASLCLDAALQKAGASRPDISGAISTGYGRANVAFVTERHKTEIGCIARGCRHWFEGPLSIIDIGGQDNKIIHLGSDGKRSSFKMNRKCAAGTGAFLEEMALRLDIPLERMDELARRSEDMIRLGSYCTVFSATEVLECIRGGRKVEDIVKGLFFSVIKRVLEMDSLCTQVVMTGGVVAHNPFLMEMTAQMLERPVRHPEHPQLAGAVGAALYALDESDRGTDTTSEFAEQELTQGEHHG